MYVVMSDDFEVNYYFILLFFVFIFDVYIMEFVEIEKLLFGIGKDIDVEIQFWILVKFVEYSVRILGEQVMCQDFKFFQVNQFEGLFFSIVGCKVLWQKWSFQFGWIFCEGLVFYDVCYDGIFFFYWVFMSEMIVFYGDFCLFYYCKQVFDLGDFGFGFIFNSLVFGCDCLGLIVYFDGVWVVVDGSLVIMFNVVCMYEIDDGIGWKYINFCNGMFFVIWDCKFVV